MLIDNYSTGLFLNLSLDNFKCDFIKTHLDKQIIVLDYDHTIKLHKLPLEKRQVYEKNLYDILFTLKTHYKKKIYLVSYNLKPYFNDEYKDLFEEIYIPKKTNQEEFFTLQKKMRCNYTIWCSSYYRYIPKYIHIKEIAYKNNVELNNVIFFDDNLEQITQANTYGIHTVLVDPLKGIEL